MVATTYYYNTGDCTPTCYYEGSTTLHGWVTVTQTTGPYYGSYIEFEIVEDITIKTSEVSTDYVSSERSFKIIYCVQYYFIRAPCR